MWVFDLPVADPSGTNRVFLSHEIVPPGFELARVNAPIAVINSVDADFAVRNLGQLLVGALTYSPRFDEGGTPVDGILSIGTVIPLEVLDLTDPTHFLLYLSLLARSAEGSMQLLATGRLDPVTEQVTTNLGDEGDMNVESVRQEALGILNTVYPHVSVSEWGSIIVSTPETPVVCRIREIEAGVFVIGVASPILLDLDAQPSLYELISVTQVSLPFGSIVVGAGAGPNQIMLEVQGQVFADNLNATHLIRAASQVHAQAVSQIHLLESITPAIGGTRAYDAS